MSRFFLSGLINLETTLALEDFPLDYFPVRYPFFGIQTSVSGVGFNLAAALTKLGNQVEFASLIGPDENGSLVRNALFGVGVKDDKVLERVCATPQSVILYDRDGRRQIHVDLKDIQDLRYPEEMAREAIANSDLAVLCNINFSRNLIPIAQAAGIPIAADVHALANLADDYNRDFIATAEILFLSDESLLEPPEAVAKALLGMYEMRILVIGLGDKGALLAVREKGFMRRFPAVYTRPVVNTIGAGDALFASFLDRYLRWGDPVRALEAAMVFASFKVGEKGAAEGFLSGSELEGWIQKIKE